MKSPKIDKEVANLNKPSHTKLQKAFVDNGYLNLYTNGDISINEDELIAVENSLFEAVSQKLILTSSDL